MALFIGLVGIMAALDLTLRSSGYMQRVGWLPGPIAYWADSHGQFRNLPAFFLLALPFLIVFRGRSNRIKTTGALAAFAAVLEFAQFLRPNRWVEWEDIALSWAGLLLAFALYETLRLGTKRLILTKPVRRLQSACRVRPAIAGRGNPSA